MGTRCLVHIKEDGRTITTIYRLYDGYPEGMGDDIKRAVGHLDIVNGYNNQTPQANGMGCLAAQLIAKLKDGVGNVYIYAPDSVDMGEDYTYILSDKRNPNVSADRTWVKCMDGDGETVYEGFLTDWNMSKDENL